MKKIRIGKKDEVKGFNVLINGDFSILCLAKNEYIVSDEMLKRLKDNKIDYKLISKKT